ncbi:MAG: four helix bundle protein [Phycisphaerales bacterium JB064]
MSEGIRSYRDLGAWQQARILVRMVYEGSLDFPPDERFGLTAQIRRAAVGVASNIAEGYGRGGHRDYGRFLRIARGSLFEVETQLILANDLGFVASQRFDTIMEQINTTAKPLAGLIRAVEQSMGN